MVMKVVGQCDRDGPGTSSGRGSNTRPGYEKRRYERHPFRCRLSVSWILAGRPERARPIDAQDLGQGGIGFVSRAPIPVGTVGVIMLPRRGRPPLLHVCRVANCHYDGEMQHRIGAEWIGGDPHALGVRIARGPSGPRLDVFR
jgi:hypothetical protein